MKKIIPLFAIFASCQKETPTLKPQPLSLERLPVVVFTPVIQSSIFTYSYGTKTLPLLFNRTLAGKLSNCALADTSGKTVYLTFVINDSTGVISDVTTPNLVPFNLILPPDTDGSWKICLWNALKTCAANPLCSNGTCRGEAIVGCVASWSVACIFKLYVPVITKTRPHLIDNLPPIKYV